MKIKEILMYISNNGKLLVEPKYMIADDIFINMSTDVNDTPLAKYGIKTNISKDNFNDTVTELKLMILDWIQYCELKDLNLDDVKYENGCFTAYFNYKGNRLSMKAL